MAAFPRAVADEIGAFITDDAVWHDAPTPPVQGRTAIRARLRSLFARSVPLRWVVRHIAASGEAVLTERMDAFRVAQEPISRPCMGTFEVRNGHIVAWRDSWDRQQFEHRLQSATA